MAYVVVPSMAKHTIRERRRRLDEDLKLAVARSVVTEGLAVSPSTLLRTTDKCKRSGNEPHLGGR